MPMNTPFMTARAYAVLAKSEVREMSGLQPLNFGSAENPHRLSADLIERAEYLERAADMYRHAAAEAKAVARVNLRIVS